MLLIYDIYRNYIYLGFTIYTSYAYFFIENKLFASQIISAYTLADCILSSVIKTQYDMLLHHGLLMGVYLSYVLYSYSEPDINLISSDLLSFQISSIFLSINSIHVNDYPYKSLNMLAFLSTFLYYRIYKYYYVLSDIEFQNVIYKYNSNIMILFYAFYALNMYWTCFIIKKLMKTLKLNAVLISDNIKTEWLLQYMLFLNIPISYYKCIQSDQPYLLLDVAGNAILAVGNYKCHKNLYLNYKNNEPLELFPYLCDHIGIRIRVALSLISFCLIQNDFYNLLYVSIINHIGSSLVAIYLTKHISMREFNAPSNLKSSLINWLQFNILIETIVIGYIRQNIFDMCIILFLVGMVYKHKIFYNYSHVVFHVLLVVQNALV